MIIGIGTDLIEVVRVEKACENKRFLVKNFTEKEQELFTTDSQKVAGNFAVKESVAKAFGTGFRHFSLHEIEVLRDTLGKPYVNLYGNALEVAKQLGINQIHVSITNTKEYASAFVIAEKIDD